MTNDKRAEEFLKCLGNGSGSEEQAYADDTPDWDDCTHVAPKGMFKAIKSEDIYTCETCGKRLIGLTMVNIHSIQRKHYEYRNSLFDKMRLMIA